MSFDESERLQALLDLNILDTLPDKNFDDITKLVSYICDVPIALITLVDDKRQWFKSKVGVDFDETPIDQAFCAYTITQDKPFIVEDATKDPRFQDNKLVADFPKLRFYAGTQIRFNEKNIGSLCAIDKKKRVLDERQLECLQILSDHVTSLLKYKRYEYISSANIETVSNLLENKRILEKVNNIKSALLTNICHEIKTPLNGIVSSVESLSELIFDGNAQAFLKTLNNSTDDLVMIITNLMDLVSDHIILHPQQILLKQQLYLLFENFKFKASEKLISMSYTDDSILEETKVYGDVTRLYNIVSSFLSNAVKYTPVGGKIHITAQLKISDGKQMLFYKVDDNGIGISPTEARSVFKPLTQLDISSTKETKGLGNGLCVTKKIVECMDGVLDYSSDIGKGSSFWFIIPMTPYKENEKVLKKTLRSVLIVDDNELNVTIASALLKKINKGIIIDKAFNGREAVEKSLSVNFDLVLMDCQMPIMNGFDATRNIRAEDTNVYIMALTASSESNDIQRCYDVGMNDVMSKPVILSNMKTKLREKFEF